MVFRNRRLQYMNNSTTIAHQLLMECKETVDNSDLEMYNAITEICKNSNDEETRKIAIEANSKSNQYAKRQRRIHVVFLCNARYNSTPAATAESPAPTTTNELPMLSKRRLTSSEPVRIDSASVESLT